MGRRKIYKNENRIFTFLSWYVITSSNDVIPFANANIQISQESFLLGLALHLKENNDNFKQESYDVNLPGSKTEEECSSSPNTNNTVFKAYLSMFCSNSNAIIQSFDINFQISFSTFLIVYYTYLKEKNPSLYFTNNDSILPSPINQYLKSLYI